MSLYVFSYLCLIVFVLGAGARILKQKRLPLHVRWELYPVKHEAGPKARYGRSYMEEPDWWEKKKTRSLWNEVKYMIPEILFLRGLWEENRKLWRVSFPFHFGLYLVIGTFGLLLIGALAMILGTAISPAGGMLAAAIYYFTILLGFLGPTLGAVGASGLLARRLRDPELKAYSGPADYINLILLLMVFGVGLCAWLFSDQAFDGARAYFYGLLTFGGKPEGYAGDRSILGWLTILLGSAVFAYIPLTHMARMFMKYFTYHKIRWEDAPNVKGSRIEAEVLKNLGFRPTWAASHIGADGKKTWAEIAAPR